MRVYIYDELLISDYVRQFEALAIGQHLLDGQAEYFEDFCEYFYSCRVMDAEDADCFFVPLFLAAWQFMNVDPGRLISGLRYLDRGRHVLVATADCGQRAESRHEMQRSANPRRAYDRKYAWLDDRFSLIALESVETLRPQDVAFLAYDRKPLAASRDRDIFLGFMGKMTQEYLPASHIRGGRLYELRDLVHGCPEYVIGSSEAVSDVLGKIAPQDFMARCKFALCPAGYGRWTFRLGEALKNGAIPVVLSDDYVFPYNIPWGDYVIRVPEADLLKVPEILSAIPASKIVSMQEAIRENAECFQRQFAMQEVEKCLPKMR